MHSTPTLACASPSCLTGHAIDVSTRHVVRIVGHIVLTPIACIRDTDWTLCRVQLLLDQPPSSKQPPSLQQITVVAQRTGADAAVLQVCTCTTCHHTHRRCIRIRSHRHPLHLRRRRKQRCLRSCLETAMHPFTCDSTAIPCWYAVPGLASAAAAHSMHIGRCCC